MKKYLLLTTLFYLLSLAFTTVSFAEYNNSDSDYVVEGATASERIEWSSNISSCKIRYIPFPQQKVDIAALEDHEFHAYLGGNTIETESSGIYVEFYGSNGSWCKAGDWQTESVKVIFKQNNQVYAEYNGKLSDNGYLCDGRYTFVNGEVWSVKNDSSRTIDIPSAAKLKIKQASKSEREKREQAKRIEREKHEQAERIEREKSEQAERIEREKSEQLQKEKAEKDHKIYVQKVDKFRKTLKPGTEVRLNIGDYMGRGFVLKTTKDAAEVQVNYLWVSGNRVPSGKKVWINKRELEPI